jgi:hypothetical protein
VGQIRDTHVNAAAAAAAAEFEAKTADGRDATMMMVNGHVSPRHVSPENPRLLHQLGYILAVLSCASCIILFCVPANAIPSRLSDRQSAGTSAAQNSKPWTIL